MKFRDFLIESKEHKTKQRKDYDCGVFMKKTKQILIKMIQNQL